MYTKTSLIFETAPIERTQALKRIPVMLLLLVVFISWLGYSPGVYAAPKLCVPFATGVPYWDLPPDWLSSHPSITSEQERLGKSFSTDFRRTDDPRWRGALSIGYGAGATDPAEFRALFDNTNRQLLLSWSSKVMDINKGFTAVVLGIKMGQSDTVVVQATVQQNTTVVNNLITPQPFGTGAGAYITQNVTDASGNNVNAPSWLSNTRIWIEPTNFNKNNKPAFTLQTKIPVPVGINSVSMWYSLQPSVPTKGLDPIPSVLGFTWPRGSFADWGYYQEDTDGDFNADTTHIPAVDTWGEFALGQSSGCAGVSLADSDIGVTNAQFPGSRSQISIRDDKLNKFYALPKNETGGDFDMSGIKATFYFANWGSQRGDLTGDSWSTSITNLIDVSTEPTGSTRVNMDPDLFVQNGNIGKPAAVPDKKKAQVSPSPTFKLSKAEKCKFFVENSSPLKYLAEEGNPGFCSGTPMPSANPHGCMLVKLNGSMGFLRDSALTNMDFMKASKAQRVAEISTVEGKRDVYLFVDRRNMPSYPEDNRGSKAALPPIPMCGKLKEIHEMLAKGIVPNMTTEELAAVMPTYVIHAFYDTGKKVFINGKPHLVMDQQTSFGYWMWHEGSLFGWKDTLLSADNSSDVKELGKEKDTYKVTVPNNGAVRIINTIEAVEQPPHEVNGSTNPTPDKKHWEWWQWLLLILFFILSFLAWDKRKTYRLFD